MAELEHISGPLGRVMRDLGIPDERKTETMFDEEDEPVAEGLKKIARAIIQLGNADAATPMGGLEALGKALTEASERIAYSINDLAEAVRETMAK